MNIFVVVGRLGESLTASKAIPFTSHSNVEKVYIFREEKGFDIERVEYITLSWLKNIKPNILKKVISLIAEPLQLLFYSLKLRPYAINGVYTLPKGLNSVLAAKLTGTKSIVSVIGGPLEIITRRRFKTFWKAVNLWMLRTCSAVTTKGTKVTAFLTEHGIDKDKIFNLNGSIDVKEFNIPFETKRDVDILFVGKFYNIKGPDRVIRVIKKLILEGVSVKGVFLGSGELLKSSEQLSRDLEIESCIHFEGYKYETAPYFQRAKTLMMPSTSEGLPTAMLEAMACGCVPIVSNVGNITDAAFHGKNSLVVEKWNDIEGFVDAAKKLLGDEKYRSELAVNGRKLVEERFAPEKQAKIVGRIFKYIG